MKKNVGNNIAIIPVRGGSKSIPLKNIKTIAGKPLLAWILEASAKSEVFDHIFISTDSDEIKKTCIDYINKFLYKYSSNITIIARSIETSTDEASTESVLLEFADQYICQTLCLLQATSPLTSATDIKEAYHDFVENKYDSMLTGVRQKRFIWKKSDLGYSPVNYDYNKRPRRQEFDGYLVENGSFYFMNYKGLISTESRLFGQIGFYEMSDENYLEIDEPNDWIVIENTLSNRRIDNPMKKIKLFVTDNDGVLTDGGMYYSESGEEFKKYNTRDGMGIGSLIKRNIPVVMITGENSPIAKARAKKLGIEDVYLGIKDKRTCIQEVSQKYCIPLDEIAYIGDDINDLPAIEIVGLSFAVADAHTDVKEKATFILKHKGGNGAVREASDMILKYLAD
ncbi:acylneuraminate cytidylyltransferase [Acidaminobacter sp. JC074]|uniref:acylneuraminate cytidylyltransferase n=1 Tax=Acidaminobacter sp. JC074 TaxID=2530199 RepID=UPI001F109C0E|nr:acylneuraminate cytidylyltransferase [Acidaminobacter sp. JC074]